MIYHIQKDSWSLDADNPPKQCLSFEISCLVKRHLTQFALWNFGISNELDFFAETRWIYGVKSELPFFKLIIGKSQVFSAR